MKENVLTRWFRPERWLPKDMTYSLRGLCILVILMGHASSSSTDPMLETAAWQAFADASCYWKWGTWCVGVFFVLSGYGMTLSLERQKRMTWGYVGRKMWRLFEPFLVFWVVFLIVFLLMDRERLTWELGYEFLMLRMPLGIDAWFFKAILGLYVLLLILYALPMSNLTRAAVVTVACMVYYVVMRSLCFGPWWFNTIMSFPLGVFLALRRDWFVRYPWWLLAATAVMVAMYCVFPTVGFVASLLFTLVVLIVVWLFPFNNRLLHFIGVNSLFFYLLEEPVYNYLVYPLNEHLPLYVIATWVLTGLLTWGWLWVKEKVTSR